MATKKWMELKLQSLYAFVCTRTSFFVALTRYQNPEALNLLERCFESKCLGFSNGIVIFRSPGACPSWGRDVQISSTSWYMICRCPVQGTVHLVILRQMVAVKQIGWCSRTEVYRWSSGYWLWVTLRGLCDEALSTSDKSE